MITPVIIKVIVATTDLNENLLIPHTPCPLVQPFPILVPTPTSKPPIINKGIEFVKTLTISLSENEYMIGPIINPNINNILSILFSLLIILPEAIELTPAILPLKEKNKNAANPIRDPPTKEDIGVKFITFINLLKQEIQD